MVSIEQPEIQQQNEIPEKMRNLLDGPPSDNYMLRQIQLAVEKFSHEHPNDTLDKKLLDDVGMAWADSDYSKAWNKLVKHADFNAHPRFQGRFANVTLEDLEYFIKNDRLPE